MRGRKVSRGLRVSPFARRVCDSSLSTRFAATDPKLFLAALKNALKFIIAAEPEITRYDTVGGDGDAGLTLKSGAEGVEAKLASNAVSDSDVVSAMVTIGEVVEKEMGGTSGGFYAIFFSALGKSFVQAAKEKGEEKATAEVWARALEVRVTGSRFLLLRYQYHLSTARPQHPLRLHARPTPLAHPRRPPRLLHPHLPSRPFELQSRLQRRSGRSGSDENAGSYGGKGGVCRSGKVAGEWCARCRGLGGAEGVGGGQGGAG